MAYAAPKITTFLMFSGQAEEAMKFYISIFKNSKINTIQHYDDGKVMQATFSLNGQVFMCFDSTAKHDFTFTPSVSMFVKCNSEEEVEQVFSRLSEGGEVLMPLGAYPFSKKYSWLNDKFGVSWQLSL